MKNCQGQDGVGAIVAIACLTEQKVSKRALARFQSFFCQCPLHGADQRIALSDAWSRVQLKVRTCWCGCLCSRLCFVGQLRVGFVPPSPCEFEVPLSQRTLWVHQVIRWRSICQTRYKPSRSQCVKQMRAPSFILNCSRPLPAPCCDSWFKWVMRDRAHGLMGRRTLRGGGVRSGRPSWRDCGFGFFSHPTTIDRYVCACQ